MRFLIILVGMLISTFSFGQSPSWSLAATSSEGTVRFFVDRNRVRRENGLLMAWILTEYQKDMPIEGTNKTFRSKILQYYINCTARSWDYTSAYSYAGSMGNGEIVQSNNFKLDQMKTPPPNSMGEGAIISTCNIFASQSAPRKAVPIAPKKALPAEINPF